MHFSWTRCRPRVQTCPPSPVLAIVVTISLGRMIASPELTGVGECVKGETALGPEWMSWQDWCSWH